LTQKRSGLNYMGMIIFSDQFLNFLFFNWHILIRNIYGVQYVISIHVYNVSWSSQGKWHIHHLRYLGDHIFYSSSTVTWVEILADNALKGLTLSFTFLSHFFLRLTG
jgi:hypothetical protein